MRLFCDYFMKQPIKKGHPPHLANDLSHEFNAYLALRHKDTISFLFCNRITSNRKEQLHQAISPKTGKSMLKTI